LRSLLALLPAAKPYAVGRVAQRALAALGLEVPYIRHPSHGGKRQFAAGLAALPILPIHS
jgi:uracil-DNA glycosylase